MEWKNIITTIIIVMVSVSILLYVKVFDFQRDYLDLTQQVTQITVEMNKHFQNMQWYLEGRVNRLAQTQDEYQISTSRRLDTLEQRLKKLENNKKGNNNSN